MLVPSRLKEYPVGTTSPTTDFEAPSRSSFSISWGSALSEDDVPNTSSSSSLMYPINRKMLNPANRAISPRTTTTKRADVR